jgi:catechol 2,3-dioxygenase-like lactoylglutathione lyase family enzyme
MDYKLEVVVVPVSDVDRAKGFYGEQCGFVVDLDTSINDNLRIVQLTPRGSQCSISIGKGIVDSVAGSLQGLQLVVDDIDAARAELSGRGVAVGPVRHFENGVWLDGHGGRWNSFADFKDPDGNGWTLQERPSDQQ